MDLIEITIDDMRAAGKPGYVAKIVAGEKRFLSACDQTGYSTSRQKVTYHLKEDGIYEVCNANYGSSKREIYFLKIEDGEEVCHAQNLSEILAKDEELPELEGSEKQIAWAESLRQKLIAKLKMANKDIPNRVFTETSVKFWIDNRSKIGVN